MSADDRHLVLQARAGDPQAFRQLVERYQGKAYGIACGMLGDPDEAMDVVQEAFVKVHRYLDRFKGSSGFYTWLYRIVVNVAIDHLRKVGKAGAVDYDDARAHEGEQSDLLPSTLDMDPELSLARREIRDRVSEALGRLSPNHRAAILLREVEGLSYTEMAEAMQCSKGTIMSRLFHARRRMQVALLELMDEPAKRPTTAHGGDGGGQEQQQRSGSACGATETKRPGGNGSGAKGSNGGQATRRVAGARGDRQSGGHGALRAAERGGRL